VHVVEVHYYEQPGPDNTDDVLSVVSARCSQLGINQVVVASTHGTTALKAREVLPANVKVIAVSISAAFGGEGWLMTDEERARLMGAGVVVFTGLHALGDDVSEAVSGNGWPPNRVVRETLYRFSQGMKVAVEVSIMAAEAGLLDMDSDLIAVAGSDQGADTAVVLRPAYARDFRELKVREVLAMPR